MQQARLPRTGRLSERTAEPPGSGSRQGEEGAVLGELLWQPGAGCQHSTLLPAAAQLSRLRSLAAIHPTGDVLFGGRVSSYKLLLSLSAAVWEPTLDTVAAVTWRISKRNQQKQLSPTHPPVSLMQLGLGGPNGQPGLRSSAFLNPCAGQVLGSKPWARWLGAAVFPEWHPAGRGLLSKSGLEAFKSLCGHHTGTVSSIWLFA